MYLNLSDRSSVGIKYILTILAISERSGWTDKQLYKCRSKLGRSLCHLFEKKLDADLAAVSY